MRSIAQLRIPKTGNRIVFPRVLNIPPSSTTSGMTYIRCTIHMQSYICNESSPAPKYMYDTFKTQSRTEELVTRQCFHDHRVECRNVEHVKPNYTLPRARKERTMNIRCSYLAQSVGSHKCKCVPGVCKLSFESGPRCYIYLRRLMLRTGVVYRTIGGDNNPPLALKPSDP